MDPRIIIALVALLLILGIIIAAKVKKTKSSMLSPRLKAGFNEGKSPWSTTDDEVLEYSEVGDIRDIKKKCRQVAKMKCKGKKAIFGGRGKCKRKEKAACYSLHGI